MGLKIIEFSFLLMIFHQAATELNDMCPIKKQDEYPLILTPYIESGDIEEAQNLSAVNLPGFEDIKSHSGYFTVNQENNSNLFFWYFIAKNSHEVAPVVLWLQGGPGVSSMYGLFLENGPFQPNGVNLDRRAYSWNNDYHMIYIDNPVGTGYSFTKVYVKDQITLGNHLYEGLIQFLRLFPDLQDNDFYIAGESYAGKYVTTLSHVIHKNNKINDFKISLKGFAIGNGVIDPVVQWKYSDFLYEIGLLDRVQLKKCHSQEELLEKHVNNKNWNKANMALYDYLSNSNEAMIRQYTGYNNYLDILSSEEDLSIDYIHSLMNSYELKKILHTGYLNSKISDSSIAYHLVLDFTQSVSDWFVELLRYYKVVVYNGQLDIILPYRTIENYLMNLTFSGSEEFRNSKKNKWFVDGELAGYSKSGGNLSLILVRNSGHSVPIYQPKWTMDIIKRLTNNIDFEI